MEALTKETYFAAENRRRYWSVSQFKAFERCEAAGLAELRGEYEREETTALLVGSYVDAYFSGDRDSFIDWHPEIFNKRTGELKSDYRHADEIIEAIRKQPLMMDYLTGYKQVIRSAELFGVEWKIKMDVYQPGDRIVDLKIIKDFDPIYKEGFGMLDWVRFWGYDIQGAVYQRIEQISSSRDKPLPFYLVAATKEKTPDVAVIHLPQHILDAALKVVEHKIDRFDLVKTGEIPPTRCEKCDYCKKTKQLREVVEYDIEEGGGA